MLAHGLTGADIEHVLTTAHASHLDRRGNRVITGRVARRLITVVVAAGSVPQHVITVWDRGPV